MKFRTPHKCQNGHHRFSYWRLQHYKDKDFTWGEKHPDCKCPTFYIGQGFKPSGPNEMCCPISEHNGEDLYINDIIKSQITGAIYIIQFGPYSTKNDNGIGFWLKAIEGTDRGIFSDTSSVVRIGNVHENPELLK